VEFFCIGDEETVLGFGLAGIEGKSVTTPEQTRAALAGALAASDYAVVMITDVVAQGIRPEIEAIRFERERPLIVEIPGPGGPLPGRRSLREVVQEAIGMRIS
jgi:V/A-type H+-transporting ATPase subunit F